MKLWLKHSNMIVEFLSILFNMRLISTSLFLENNFVPFSPTPILIIYGYHNLEVRSQQYISNHTIGGCMICIINYLLNMICINYLLNLNIFKIYFLSYIFLYY